MFRIAQALAMLVALACLALAAPAAAQREKAETEDQAGGSERPVVDAYFSRKLVEADEVVNRQVLGGLEGEQIGEVTDLLVDPASGRVDYAILDRSKSTGGGSVVVPYETLRYSQEDRVFELAGGDFAVGLAPKYASRQDGVYSREQFEAAYGRQLAKAQETGRQAEQIQPPVPEREAAAREGKAGAQEGGQEAQEQARQSRTGQEQAQQAQAGREEQGVPQGLVELARLKNKPLTSQDGKKVGTLDTILVDPSDGSLRVAVIEESGFLGLGESIRAVPWSKVRFDWQNHELLLDMTSKELAQAPQVDPTRRKVVFQQPPTGYEQFLFLEQQGRRADKPEER